MAGARRTGGGLEIRHSGPRSGIHAFIPDSMTPQQGRTHRSAPTKCNAVFSSFVLFLAPCRRQGGPEGGFRGIAGRACSPIAVDHHFTVHPPLPDRGTENLRSRPSGSPFPALNFQRWRALLPPYRRPPLIFRVPLRWKLSAGMPRPGQALSLVLSLGQQRKDIWFLPFKRR
jgi:hypothetical protein